MIIAFLLFAGLLYIIVSSIIRNIVDKTENKHLSKHHLEDERARVKKELEDEFPKGSRDVRQKCAELYEHAFKIVPSINRYTHLRNVKKDRYVF